MHMRTTGTLGMLARESAHVLLDFHECIPLNHSEQSDESGTGSYFSVRTTSNTSTEHTNYFFRYISKHMIHSESYQLNMASVKSNDERQQYLVLGYDKGQE